jgi:acyl-coenzyme A thioesterase PaaI-like protein
MAGAARPAETLSHHELCFGCGLANLFGLQLEVEAIEGDGVAGRFFVKQDHQGEPGFAHAGVIGAALEEAMSLAVHARGVAAHTASYEVQLHAPAPIGSFVRIEARIEKRRGKRIWTSAAALAADGGNPLAEARGLVLADDPDDFGP